MADENKTPETEETQSTETQTTEEKVEETAGQSEETQTTVTKEDVQEVQEEVDDGVEKDEDGNYVFKVDPENPKSTIYKAKTRKELFVKIAKGVKDKDIYIGELRSRQLSEEVKPVKDEESLEVTAPDYDGILENTFKRAGVDKSVLNWTTEQWKDYELNNGGALTLKLMNLVEGAQAIAKEQVQKENVAFVNDTMLKEETEQVIELVKESGVEFTKDDYRNILEAVESDKSKSYRSNGIRKQGIIVRMVSAKIRELAEDKAVKGYSTKKAEESAKNRLKKDEVTTVGKTKAEPKKQTALPKNFDEATAQILKELKHKT
jgi:hypothetical protein